MAIIDRRGITVDAAPSSASSSDPSAHLAIKTPVRVATTAAITLSGEQTIDGVSVVAGDRVLAKDQGSAVENGIYKASSGNWERATDFDSPREVVEGTLVYVNEGTTQAGSSWVVTSNDPIVPDTDAITFGSFITLGAASQAEAEAGSNNAKYMTPLRTKQAVQNGEFFTPAGTGAVARTFTAKARDYIDARDFGLSASASATANMTAINALFAHAATLGRAAIEMPAGVFDINGTPNLSGTGIHWRGAGSFQTILNQKVMSTPGVYVTGQNCRVSGIGVNYDGTPISGADAWTVQGVGTRLNDVLSLASYRGFVFSGSHDLHAVDIISTAHEANGLLFSSVIGGHVANARINAGTVARATLGNVRMVNQVEAIQFINLEALSGLFGLTVDASVDSFGTRAAWNEFTNCIFDAADRGSVVNRMRGSGFHNCFFSGGRSGSGYHGVEFTNSKNIAIDGSSAVNSGKAGISIGTGCSAFRISKPFVHSNSVTAGAGVNAGIEVAAGLDDIAILYPAGGNEIAGGQQGYDVTVAAGTGSNHVIRHNSVGGTVGKVSFGATGAGNIVEVDGRVGLGVAPSTAAVEVKNIAGTTVNALKFTTYGGPVIIRGYRSGGTPGSESAVTTTQTLASFRGGGYQSAAFIDDAAQLGFFANQNWTPTALGTHFRLNLTPDGSTTLTEILRVFGSGGFALGGTTDPGAYYFSTIGGIRSSGATQGIGYATGAGGTVTQITSKATAVTLDKVCGTITTHNANLGAATIVSFVWNNSAIAATDAIHISHESGGTLGAYTVNGRATGAGTAAIDIRNNTAGILGEALVLRFSIIKGVSA